MVSRTHVREKIKPVWVLSSNRWGGREQVGVSDMVDLAAAGIPVTVMCPEGSPAHAAVLRHPTINVCPLVTPTSARFDWGFVRVLRNMIEDVDANIVHITDESLLWFLVPSLFRRPDVSIVASRHAPIPLRGGNIVNSLLLKRIDYMIVLSESVKETFLHRRLIPEKRLKVINLGLDYGRFDSGQTSGGMLRTMWGADKDTIVIGSVGRLLPEVGQDTFIKAAAGLIKYTQWKMRFVIVGEEPVGASEEYVKGLKSLVSQFHMEDQVVFANLGDNLPEVMSAFDIFVMPGREEVPGLGALEALAMERPVVLSNVVGAQDIVGNGDYGLLVRPEDAFDLQSKILVLLQNPSHRLSMGANGRVHVLKHFDKRTRLLRTVDIYERCIKRRFSWSVRS